jgi:DNA-binding MarR family transcriptional regulator
MYGHSVLDYFILCTELRCGGNTTEEISIMKNPIENLNKIFDSRIRLGIMSALVVNEEVNFNELKELIQVTDGNLASHLKTLEENGYVKVHKGFIGRKTNTTYSVTKAGQKAFKSHLDALEKMIRSIE